MNIIDVQDQLKDFSEQQLIKEMQMPSGNAPQFLVLTEIQRRKRMRDDFAKRQAAAEPTVAQEALSASGVPTEEIAGMSEAMAPQSAASDGIGTIMPQTMRQSAPPPAPMPDDMAMGMRSGGLMSYGDELSQRMSNDKIDPFLDEVEQMASDRFGFQASEDTGGLKRIETDNTQYARPAILEPYPPRFGGGKGAGIARPIQAVPFSQSLNRIDRGFRGYSDGGIVNLYSGGKTRIEERRMPNGKIGLFRGNTFLGLKEENKSRGSIAEKIGFGKDRDILGRIKDALGLQEGGVVKAQTGAYFPSTAELYGLYGQESGYGQNLFGSAGEIGPFQILPTTAIMPGNQIKSLFPELEAAIARGDYKDAEAAYRANKAMVDEALMSGEKVEPFVLDYLDNAERVLGNRDLATLAYNQGIGGTEGFSGNVLDTDYVSGVRSNMSGFDEAREKLSEDVINQDMGQKPDMISGLIGAQASTNDAINPQLVDSGRMSPAAIAAERYKRLGEISAQKAAGNQTTGADMPSGTLTDLPPDAQFFATEQEEKRIAEEQEQKATTAFPDYSGPPGQEDLYKQIVESKNRLDRVFDKDYAQPPSDGDDKVTPKGAGKTPDATTKGNVNIRSTGDTSGAISLSDEIKALQKRMEKNRESDKWLALAQAGLALMSSDNPTLLGAAGEAGIEGLKAMREANERYEEGVIDLINARAKLVPKDKMGLSASNVVSLINRLEEDISTGMLSEAEKEQKRLQIAGLRRMIQLPEQTFGVTKPPAAAAS